MRLVFSWDSPTNVPAYRAWVDMRRRCTQPSYYQFHHYGGRGITVCDQWMNDYDAFYRDMGPQPIGTTLERVENSEGYGPFNCAWVPMQAQLNNRRNTRIIEFNGKIQTIAEWSRELHIPFSTIKRRLDCGYPPFEKRA